MSFSDDIINKVKAEYGAKFPGEEETKKYREGPLYRFYVIDYTYNDTWVSFVISEVVCGIGSDGSPNGEWFYADKSGCANPAESPSSVSVLCDGFVKWDGCSEFRASHHVCSYSDLRNWLKTIEHAYHQAGSFMPTFEGE